MHMFSHTPTSTSANEALIRHGFIGCSPDQPALAFPLRLFEVYRQLHRVCPRFSLDALSKTLAYLHFGPRKSALASQLSTTYDAYLEIIRGVEARCRVALGRTGTWYMDNVCPPCLYKTINEPYLKFSWLGAMDGNNSLKSIANEFKSGSVRSDDRLRRDVHDRWLTPEEVDLFKDEVADSQKTDPLADPSPDAEPGDLDDDVAWLNVNELESADVEELERCLNTCVDRWRAAGPDARKKMFALFAVSGIFLSVCRHGHVIVMCDMIRSGELMKYPLAIIKSILDRYGKDVCIGYDIMCAFFKTLLRSSLGKRVVAMKLRGVVPAFHGHAHNRRNFIYQNYRQAIEKIKINREQLRALELRLSTTAKDYEDDLRSEQAYFKALRCEPPEISATESDKAKSDWNARDYHIINGIGRAEIIHINTRYRTTHTKYLATEEEVCRFEETNDIVNRWTSTSQPYIDGIVLMTERRYRLAVDELERLVVQRLFEMTKLSMSGVGYKMREKIGKALQTRKDAIRHALDRYNAAGASLNPPRPKLSYNTIINHATLAEFDWLRETRNDIRALGWADPTRREAGEEKTRCNVEIRRLVTSMVDDHVDQYRAIAANMVIAPELARELSRRWIVRNRINTAIAKRLAQASRLPGFTGSLFPGDREVEYKEPVDSGDDDDEENSRTDQQQQEFDINGMGREEDFEEDSMLDLIENIRQLET
ncbi:hypothetical protein B0H10DRAFT_2373425 [Mycena sp. CBHHK59/15]|nr:hypothetical protein B0H10DRAFT_2373425 [Mycena sp. CBHHK59/15]